MKKSLRLPLSFFVLVAVFTFFTCRSVVLREGYIPAESFQDHSVILPLNSSLIDLASADPYEPALKKEVEDLLQGNFPNSRGRHRTISSVWRRDNHGIISDPRLLPAVKIRPRNPVDHRILPAFRRALRDWIRSRRFHPSVMSSLPDLVKTPLDRHFGIVGPAASSRLYDSCAVIGNSGILLNSDHGQLIDDHQFVIRLNNARTHGYARHVGAKTNLSFVNSNILHLCARRDTCFCHPYGKNVPIIIYICQPVHFLDYATCNSSHEAPLLVTDARFDLLCARIVKYYSLKGFAEETRKKASEWGKFHDEKMFHYSSGMQAVVLAVGMCRKVSVFGFGKSAEAKHHYHTNQKAELDLHDYAAEYAFYRDLSDRPEVIPFLKDSGIKIPPVVFYH